LLKVIIALLFLVSVGAAYFAFRKTPIVDSDGVKSPYLKGGLLDDAVYFSQYHGDGLMGGYEHKIIPNSHKDTFEIATIKLTMPGPEDGTLKLGKTADHYFLGNLILPFDPMSERLVRANRDRSKGPLLYITERRVFFLRGDELLEIPGVDPQSFWILDTPSAAYRSGYAKDLNKVVYFSESDETGPGFILIKDADAKTFEETKFDYAKDKSRQYHKDKVDNSGPIVKLDQVFSKNDLVAFYYDSPIAGVDAKSFAVISNGFSRDKSQLFYEDKLVPNVDPNNFSDLTNNESGEPARAAYIKDNKSVLYYTGINGAFSVVVGADIESFRHAGNAFATDGLHVYYEGKLLPEIERAGFEVLYKKYPMGLYVKNDRHVYLLSADRKMQPVNQADPKSFAAYEAAAIRPGGFDAEDERHYFSNGKAIKSKK
jgi:hypothetical protein